eukprot:3902229-Pleurochrysis_carterae.AAC.1
MKMRLIQCRDQGPDAPKALKFPLTVASRCGRTSMRTWYRWKVLGQRFRKSRQTVEKTKICSNASSSDDVRLGQNAPSKCSKRRAKFQERGGSGRGAMPT